MDYQIFVEQQSHNGFIATALGWPDCVVTAPTKEEAVVQVRAVVAERLTRGEIFHVQLDEPMTDVANDPWERMAGRFADDPNWDEYEEELRRIRAEANRA